MSARKQIVMYGSSGNARTIADMLASGFEKHVECEVVAYIDDFIGRNKFYTNDAPLISFEVWRTTLLDVPCIFGMGSPNSRKQLSNKVSFAGGAFANIYADRPKSLYRGATIGIGTFIGHYCYIGLRTKIGDHVHVLPLSCIGHDVTIKDFCTICPSCTISGHITIEEGVYVGAGTTIVNGTDASPLCIGRGAKIWAGSVVTGSVPAGATVGGNPAVPLRQLVQRRRMLKANRPTA